MTAPDDSSALDVLDVSLVVIDLVDFHIRAISRNATDYLGLAATAVVGHSALAVPMPDRDRRRAERALVALRDGVVDFFRSSYTLFRADGTTVTVWEWVRAILLGDERVALAEGAPGTEPRPSALARYLGREPSVMAIGTVDADWTVTSISSEISALVGASPEDRIGWRLVSSVVPEDVHRLLDAGALASGDRAVGLRVRLRGKDGVPRPLRCVLASLAGSGERLVVLMPDTEPEAVRSSDRAVQLEGHLLRIASELEASGILQRVGQVPDASRLPQMRSLTVRQWEILTRLLRGERVPTIASELFVSQSTVRNHLSAIFGRFGVHSQPELLALLRRKD